MIRPPWRDAPDKPIVLAFGGNALSPTGSVDGKDEERAEALAAALLLLLPDKSGLVLVHGNGPQVGTILLRVEETRGRLPVESLDVLVAETQGSIGYLLTRALRNVTQRRQHQVEIATIGTQVEVDAEDPAFANPTKPIGPFYTTAEGEKLVVKKGWAMVEVPDRGMRRVVPSPRPRSIIEYHTIAAAVEGGRVVVAGGGGGIPVTRNAWGEISGVEAVIDKDLTASLIARSLGAVGFVILTEADGVYDAFGTPDQRRYETLPVADARQLLEDGKMPAGSMGPKVEAAADYTEAIGLPSLITSVERLENALDGTAGTWVVP